MGRAAAGANCIARLSPQGVRSKRQASGACSCGGARCGDDPRRCVVAMLAARCAAAIVLLVGGGTACVVLAGVGAVSVRLL